MQEEEETQDRLCAEDIEIVRHFKTQEFREYTNIMDVISECVIIRHCRELGRDKYSDEKVFNHYDLKRRNLADWSDPVMWLLRLRSSFRAIQDAAKQVIQSQAVDVNENTNIVGDIVDEELEIGPVEQVSINTANCLSQILRNLPVISIDIKDAVEPTTAVLGSPPEITSNNSTAEPNAHESTDEQVLHH